MKLKTDKSFGPLIKKFDDFTVNLDNLEKPTSLSQSSLSEIRGYLMDRIHAHSFNLEVIGKIQSPLIKQHLETLFYEQFNSTDELLEELELENEAFNAYISYKNKAIIKDDVTSITMEEPDNFKENKQALKALKLLAKLTIPLSQSLPMINDIDDAIQKLTNKIIDLTNQKKDGVDVDEELLAARTDIKTLMKLKADNNFGLLTKKFNDFTVNLDNFEKPTSLSQSSLSEIRSYLMDNSHALEFNFEVIGNIQSPSIKQYLETLFYEQFGSTSELIKELEKENKDFEAYISNKNKAMIKDGNTSITWKELDAFSGDLSSPSSPITRNSSRSSLDSPRSEDTLASESPFGLENHPYLKPLRRYIEKKILEQVIKDASRSSISFNLNGKKTLPYSIDQFFIDDNFKENNFVVNSIVPSQFSDLLTVINESSKDSSYQNLKLALAAFFSSTQAFDADLDKSFRGKIQETLINLKEKYGLSEDVFFGSFKSTKQGIADKNNVSFVDDKLILRKDVVRELMFITLVGPVQVPFKASWESIISGNEITTKFLSYDINYDGIHRPF